MSIPDPQRSDRKAAESSTCFLNARVRTLDPAVPRAEAVVARNGRISFVGSSREARSRAGPGARCIDLGGKHLLPGFIDSHVHCAWGGEELQGLHLGDALSVNDFRRRIAEHVSGHRGRWVTGGGWDHQRWTPPLLPTKGIIDECSPDTPILVRRSDSHVGLANSCALRLAGITAQTPDPPGGIIVRDPGTGDPTGILKDAALELVSAIIPPPSPAARESALLAAQSHAVAHGLTSVHDVTLPPDLDAFRRLEQSGTLRIRVHARVPLSGIEQMIETGIRPGAGSERLRIGSLKAFADGSLGASTALFFEPYADDPTSSGLSMEIVNTGELLRLGRLADRHGYQLSIHAIGDRANAAVLDLFEKIAGSSPVRDRRFRIEHAQHVRREDILRFSRLGVIASMQPYHLVDDGTWAERRIGADRAKTAFAFRSFLDAGVTVCFGSDWTVAPLDPLSGIMAAATRRTADGRYPDGWNPAEKISVAEAIRCYTLNAAFAAFEEGEKGMIRAGMLADLVVLSEDICSIEPAALGTVRVVMTVIGGQVVFEK